MITLSNGHFFEYMAASGALAFDGKGWWWEKPLKWMGMFDPTLFVIVLKTLTFLPKRGNLRWYNPFRCVRFVRGGVVNAVGLTNPGISWWCRDIGPAIDFKKFSVVGSIYGSPIELAEMARMLNDFEFVTLEINASCPNVGNLADTIQIIHSCEQVKKASRFPLILKLSPATKSFAYIARKAEGIVEAFSINSVPWAMVFPGKKSPLAHFGGGGVSGKAAQPFTWRFLQELVEATKIPVIGSSVWEFGDIVKLRLMGAKAISFGSLFLQYPWRPTLFVQKDTH